MATQETTANNRQKINWSDVCKTLQNNILTIVGSLGLVTAWYYEKIGISEAEKKIADLNYFANDFVSDLNEGKSDKFETVVLRWCQSHDSTREVNDYNLAASYVNEASMAVKGLGDGYKISDRLSNSEILSYQNGVFTTVDSYWAGFNSEKENQKRWLEALRQFSNRLEVNLEDSSMYFQNLRNQSVSDTYMKMLQDRKFYLWCYCFGIFLISLEKIRAVINSRRESLTKESNFQLILGEIRKVAHQKEKSRGGRGDGT